VAVFWSIATARPLPALPPPASDGATIVRDEVVTVFLGRGATESPSVDLRVWLGDTAVVLPRHEWADAPFVAVPGGRELRSERALRRFSAAASAGGPGGAQVPWRHLDLEVGGRALRLVVLPGGGPWFDDAVSWLPKVLGTTPTVLLVSDGPGVGAVRDLARRHSASLVVTAWPGDAAIIEQEGPFGELLFRIGDGARLSWTGDALELQSIDRPVRAAWTPDAGWYLGGPR
jgi:hypothetical protein